MTNFEYLEKRTNGLGTDESDIELLLLKGNLIDTDPVDMKACDNAIYFNFSIIRAKAVEKAKEGGYSMEKSLRAISSFKEALAREIGHTLKRINHL